MGEREDRLRGFPFPDSLLGKQPLNEYEEHDNIFLQLLSEHLPTNLEATHPKDITILGAGISGLTAAVSLLCSYRTSLSSLSIISDEYPPLNLSSLPAAIWSPYLSSDSRSDLWAEKHFSLLSLYLAQIGNPCVGDSTLIERDDLFCGWVEGSLFFRDSDAPKVPFSKQVRDYTIEKQDDLPPSVKEKGWRAIHSWKTISIHPLRFLGFLYRVLCRDKRVTFQKSFVVSPSSVIESILEKSKKENRKETKIIVNCTGLGSQKLRDDKELVGVRGQAFLAKNDPSLTRNRFYVSEEFPFEMGYILPRIDGNVVLGGTSQQGAQDKEEREGEREKILMNCEQLCVGAGTLLKVKESLVGFRPFREKYCLKFEWMKGEMEEKILWIDSYGLGGSGYTVSLGVSLSVVEEVEKAFGSSGKTLTAKL